MLWHVLVVTSDMILDDIWAWNATTLNRIVRKGYPFEFSFHVTDLKGDLRLLMAPFNKKGTTAGAS